MPLAVPHVTPAAPRLDERTAVRGTSALALGGFALGTTEFVSMGLLPSIAADMHVSIPTAGQFITAYALGVVVGAPLLTLSAARLTRKTQLLIFITAIAVANAVSALAPSYATLLVGRFLAGLPHGAYFGVGGVVAASLVPAERRGRAVGRMILGLTVANIVGVPLSTLLGQSFGWRSTYWIVVVIALATALAIQRTIPRVAARADAGARAELGALRRAQVWFTLATIGIGTGGFFALYAYITPTLTELGGFSLGAIPIALALVGIGMTVGTIIGGRLADWSMNRTIFLGLGAITAALLAFQVTAHEPVSAGVTVFVVGMAASVMFPALQTRLMDAAGSGQNLAGSLSHSAYNSANALGAALGGAVLAAGFSYTAPALVGAGLAVAGIVTFFIATLVARRAPSALTGAPRD